MPIDSVHPQYSRWAGRWKRCRDAYEGEDAIKAATTEYLPKLSSHSGASDPKYKSYLMRAMFFGATNRTVEGLSGLVMRKPAVIDVPEGMREYLDDVTGTGIGIQEFIKICLDEILTTGRYGIQVDVDESGINDPRGYFVGRTAEEIRNWRVEGNELSLAVFLEIEEVVNPDDPYQTEEKVVFRELFLADPNTGTDIPTVSDGPRVMFTRIWREDPRKKGEYLPSDPVRAERRIGEVDVIPFTFIGKTSTESDVEKPPLLDLVNVNLSHYRNSADLEHGRHFTGLPTPVISGIEPDEGDEVNIGSETAITIKDAAGRASYLEFTGQGLTTLENGMSEKKEDMAVLGARILEVSKKAAETAETTRLNKSGDTSTMISAVGAVEQAVTIALEQWRDWEGYSGNVSVEINRDLLDEDVDPALIAELLKLIMEGLMSKETFFKIMQKRDLYGDEFDVEDEIQRIQEQAPFLRGDSESLDKEEP